MSWIDDFENKLSRVTGILPSEWFASIENLFNTALDGYALEAATAFNTGVSAILATTIAIHFTIKGLAIIRGDIQDSMASITKDIVRMTLVLVIGLTFANFTQYVIGAIRAAEAFVVSGFSGGRAISVGAAVGKLYDPAMVVVDGEKYSAAGALWAAALKHPYAGVIPDFGFIIASLCVSVSQLVVAATCIIPFLMAKVYLALLIAIGPLAMFMLITPATQKYFENWLASAISQIITQGLVVAVASMLPVMFSAMLKAALKDVSIDFNGFEVGFILLALAVILALIANNITSFASQLSGGGSAPDGKGVIATVVQMAITRSMVRGAAKAPTPTAPGPGGGIGQGGGASPSNMGRNVGYAAGRAVQTLMNNLNSKPSNP